MAGPASDSVVPVTLTVSVPVAVPAAAFTVIVRLLWSPGVVTVACANPFASVVPAGTVLPTEVTTGATAPELTWKDTGTPASRLLFESFTIAEIVAPAELSDGICGEFVSKVKVFWALEIVTFAVPDALPFAAVTVIVVPAAAVPAASVAFAVPVVSVVACVAVMVPALAVNAIVTPLTTAALASCATTVMSAELEPSEGMDAVLLVTVRLATVAVVVPVPVVPVPELLPPAVAKVEPPPHAASDNAATPKTKIEAKFLMFLT